jgi:hypothetical protein
MPARSDSQLLRRIRYRGEQADAATVNESVFDILHDAIGLSEFPPRQAHQKTMTCQPSFALIGGRDYFFRHRSQIRAFGGRNHQRTFETSRQFVRVPRSRLIYTDLFVIGDGNPPRSGS